MSRLALYALAVRTCAGLVFALGTGTSAAADECDQRYRSCNLGCDQSLHAVEKVAVCKNRCDHRLIACDRQPVNASTPGDRYSPQSLLPRGSGGLQPITGGNQH